MVSGISKLAFFGMVAGAFSVARAEINLTPTYSVRELDGCKFPQLEFRDADKRITYELPKGWTCMAHDKSTLALMPPNNDSVSAKIKFIPTAGPLVLDEVQLNHFRETAYQLLPPESKMMAEPAITPDPLLLNAHHTCEIDILFALHSQRLRMSVLFVDLGDSQLRFSLIARPANFEELHKAFQESWYSWQWLDAK
jgi:hypothetical protein